MSFGGSTKPGKVGQARPCVVGKGEAGFSKHHLSRGRRGDPQNVFNSLETMGFRPSLMMIAAWHHIDPLSACGFSRRQNASLARHMVWAVMRLKEQTFREISDVWGCRVNAVFEALQDEDLMQSAAELIEVNNL